MPNKLIIKNSITAGVIPTNLQLDVGELGINVADGKLFTKKTNNLVIELTNLSNLSGSISSIQHGIISTQTSHSLVTTTTHGFLSATDKVKLDGIATGATANSTDGSLRDRTTHTGVQLISTITSLQSTLDSKETSFSVLSIAKGGTGSSTQNYVDLTTNQSISGTKTLTQVNIVAPNTSTRPLTIKGAVGSTGDLILVNRSDDSMILGVSSNTTSGNIRLRAINTFININQADGGTSTDSLTGFDPIPGNATSQAQLRFFRSTNTIGSCGITIFKGDNTTTINGFLGANGNSYLNLTVGNFGVGTNNPNAKGHIVGGLIIAAATGTQTDPGAGNLTVIGLTTTNTLIITNVNTWITPTLLNTWTNFGAPSATARYRKLPDGTIEFKGTIQKTTTPVTNESIFNLPLGFRPLEYRSYIVSSNNGVGVVIVQSNGDVVFSFGSNIWLSLENIRFVAEA